MKHIFLNIIRINLEFLFLHLTTFFCFRTKKITPRSILLIRLDAIGDYILFRNFIEVLKKDPKYVSHNITLLGNPAWKNLAKNLDEQFIQSFIWLDRHKFIWNPSYRTKKLKEINHTGYEVVVSPVFSREHYIDFIIKSISAQEKIGSNGCHTNILKWQKKIGNGYYSKLIPIENKVVFEFNRNKAFFESFLSQKIDIYKPDLLLDKHFNLNITIPQKKYAILFLGGSRFYRKWNVINFMEVAAYLIKKYKLHIVLCGGASEIEDEKIFATHFGLNYTNLVGKTSLMELLYVIKGATTIISNDTSAPHMAVGLEIKKILVVHNGNHLGRFAPYPKEMTLNYHIVYHPKIKKQIQEKRVDLNNPDSQKSRLNINDIKVSTVLERIDEIYLDTLNPTQNNSIL